MAQYYKIRKQAYTFDHVQLEYYGEAIDTEKERGLNEECEEGGKHDWLLLPLKKGHKQYLMCLKCSTYSHL